MRFDEDGLHLGRAPARGRRRRAASLWLSRRGRRRPGGRASTSASSGAALEPGAGTIEHDGVTYRRDEQGRARFRTEHDRRARRVRARWSTPTTPPATACWPSSATAPGRGRSRPGATISEHVLDVYPRGHDGGVRATPLLEELRLRSRLNALVHERAEAAARGRAAATRAGLPGAEPDLAATAERWRAVAERRRRRHRGAARRPARARRPSSSRLRAPGGAAGLDVLDDGRHRLHRT